uniref:Exosome complex component RRP46 n=1 Tax=Aceria tosichella TaxID=561515 RepID=A0A6G1SP78_9ACAR
MTRITFNNLTKADGSALIDQDDTIVQATVFGPVDIAQSKINYEEAVVEILFKPKINIPSTSPAFDSVREIEDMLKQIFKEVILVRLHPRTSISILVQEIYNNGSLLSAAINAVCCALIDAGLPLKCPVAGVSVRCEDIANCTFDFVFDNNLDLITIITRGSTTEESIKKAIKLGQDEAKKNFDSIRERVRQRFTLEEVNNSPDIGFDD